MHGKRLIGRLVATGLVVGALAAAAACGSSDDGSNPPSMGGSRATVASGDGPVQEVTIVLEDNRFEPDRISVAPGTVRFKVKNEGSAMHNVHVMSKASEGNDYMSAHMIAGGDSDEFTAVFTKSGTVDFQCDFHLPDMTGAINVE